MIYQPETVKGFQDFLPPESLKRKKIVEIAERIFSLYGFLPIETPAVEYDELMRSDSLNEEDEAISDRFRLKDKGNRNLGLRYEFTFQLARIFKQNPNIKLPFRRYQIGKNFRDEPTGPGRYREFTQCDIDIIGSDNIKSDAECLAIFSDLLKELKIEAEIEINNRKLMAAILESIKVTETKQVMKELDKIDKLGEDTVKLNLRKYADTNQILTLFKLLEKPLSFFEENMFDGAEEIKKLEKTAKAYGFKIKFNPYMIRGLSYYTGNIFEIRTKGKKQSIAGGGRYDKVVGRYTSKEIPAVGISFGLERLSEIANVDIDITKAVIISLKQDKASISLAKKLRKDNISCIISYKKPGKALEFANSQSIPFAIFVGEEEVKNKKYKLKDLQKGDEKSLTEKQLIKRLK